MVSSAHRWFGLGASIVVSLAFSGCSSSSDASSGDTLVVAMGHEAPYPGEEAVLYAIPKGLGLFDNYGIDVTYQPTSGSGTAVQLVQAGEADLGQGNPAGVMAAIDKGVDIKVVYNIIPEYGSGLAVLPSSGIDSPEDLAGKTVGVASLSSARLPEAQAMADEAGVGDDVEFVAVGVGAQAASALESKKVDGLYLWDAAYQAIELGGTDLKLIKDVFDHSSMLLDFVQYASADAIEKKAGSIEKLGKAAAVAQKWAQEHPSDALDLFYEEFPNARTDSDGRERDLAILKFTLDQFDPEGTSQSGYGDTPEDMVDATATFLTDHGLLSKAQAANTYVDNQFVGAYNDFTDRDVASVSMPK
jgi:NitT/TauT family transport system substrate-binding protein